MQSKYPVILTLLQIALLITIAGFASAQTDQETRVGTCEDAKSQMEYFCDPDKGKNDTMVVMGTACNNAKQNVKEACEGIVEDDKEYKFKDN